MDANAATALPEVLGAQATAALAALDVLRDSLAERAAHPQEFGMDGCPICKARDLLSDASLAIQDATVRIRECQPEERDPLA